MNFVRDKFSKLRWHRSRVAVGSRRHGNGCGCIPTAPHVNGREPNNSHVYGHENSLAIELNFVPRMGTPGVPLFPQKNQFSIRGVIMARLACPFWARQACSFWARKKHMFPRKFRSIGTRIPVCPCKILVQFQTHTRGPILYFSTCPSETILHPDIRSAGHCQCTSIRSGRAVGYYALFGASLM